MIDRSQRQVDSVLRADHADPAAVSGPAWSQFGPGSTAAAREDGGPLPTMTMPRIVHASR